jgi:acetyl-CoA carboxylase biotin carboxyl carrier protein
MKRREPKQQPKASSRNSFDLSIVERILALMAEHGLEEFEYESAGHRIRLRKPFSGGFAAAHRSFAPPEILVPAAGGNSAATEAAASAPQPPAADALAEAARAEDLYIIKSPIVGTFYEAPSPGAEPFVRVGDHVEAGQALCIVEAMKLMNEIECDVAGEVVRKYVENGQPVEYGESLFAIRPSRKK